MSVSFEKKGTNSGVLIFTISQDRVKPELDKAFDKFKKDLSVPGFRKGHLPRAVFNQKFSEEIFYQDVLDAILPVEYVAAVTEADLEVVAQPKIHIVSIGRNQDWTIKAEVVTKPEVKLGEYKDLLVSVDATTEVTDDEIDKKVEQEQNNLAELVVTDDAAVNGDTVVIDFVGSISGNEFAGGKSTNYSLELGSGQFVAGFEAQLMGHKAGETVHVEVIFPEDYKVMDLAGKKAKFVVTIHEVKRKEVPELDDELARDIDGDVETLDELRAKYRKELIELKETAYESAVSDAAVNLAVENAEIVELPEEMIYEDVHRSMKEFMAKLKQQGIAPEVYFQMTGINREELHNQYKIAAEKRIRTDLVVEEISRVENFKVKQEEIDQEIDSLASEYKLSVERMRDLLSDDMLKHDIEIKKAIKLITSTAKVKKE